MADDYANANIAYLVYIPSAVFVVICPLLMILRIWARIQQFRKLGSDDYVALLSLIFTLLTEGFLVGSCQWGMGRHWSTLDSTEQYESMKYFFMSQITYKAAINLVKGSILLLYLRLFSNIRWFKYACWFMIGAVTCYCIASVFASIFQCTPVARALDSSIPGHCINKAQFWFANAGFSIATDIIILLMPMPLVYKLQISGPQKIALMGVFAIGIFTVITSCLRVTTLDIFATTPDTTWDIANVMWTIIEPNVAFVCANLPIMRPFVVKLIPALRSRGSSKKYGFSGYGRQTNGTSSNRDRADWVELGQAKSDGLTGVHMTSVQRANSTAGSEESILASNGPKTGDEHIQKTVEYTIHYSQKP